MESRRFISLADDRQKDAMLEYTIATKTATMTIQNNQLMNNPFTEIGRTKIWFEDTDEKN